MGSSSKKKTTMAKLNRERRLLERRQEKQAKKLARKQASAEREAAAGAYGSATSMGGSGPALREWVGIPASRGAGRHHAVARYCAGDVGGERGRGEARMAGSQLERRAAIRVVG